MGRRFSELRPAPILAAGIFFLALILTGCDPLGELRGQDAGVSTCGGVGGAEIGGGVAPSLEATRATPVMIALRLPASAVETVDERAAEIARAQARVLEAVDAPDYVNRVRFEAIPALAGTLHTCKGLEVLAHHPDVLRIDLDLDGGGH